MKDEKHIKSIYSLNRLVNLCLSLTKDKQHYDYISKIILSDHDKIRKDLEALEAFIILFQHQDLESWVEINFSKYADDCFVENEYIEAKKKIREYMNEGRDNLLV